MYRDIAIRTSLVRIFCDNWWDKVGGDFRDLGPYPLAMRPLLLALLLAACGGVDVGAQKFSEDDAVAAGVGGSGGQSAVTSSQAVTSVATSTAGSSSAEAVTASHGVGGAGGSPDGAGGDSSAGGAGGSSGSGGCDAPDVCNGIDDDCDGAIDDGLTIASDIVEREGYFAKVAPLGDGFALVYSTPLDAVSRVSLQRLDAVGAALGVPATITANGDDPLAFLLGDQLVVFWRTLDDVRYAIFGEDGEQVGPAATAFVGSVSFYAGAVVDDGILLAVSGPGFFSTVAVSIADGGTVVEPEVRDDVHGQPITPRFARDGGGDLRLFWSENDVDAGTGRDLYSRRIDPSGVALGASTRPPIDEDFEAIGGVVQWGSGYAVGAYVNDDDASALFIVDEDGGQSERIDYAERGSPWPAVSSDGRMLVNTGHHVEIRDASLALVSEFTFADFGLGAGAEHRPFATEIDGGFAVSTAAATSEGRRVAAAIVGPNVCDAL